MQALQPVHTDNAVVASAAIDYDLILSLFVAELDAKPSTRVQYGKSIKQFFSWVKDTGRNLDFVSRIDIIAFRDSLLNGEYGEAKSTLTTSNYLTAVKMFYKWAAGRIPNRGSQSATIAVISSIDVGFMFIQTPVMPADSNWNTPCVLPSASIAKVAGSLSGTRSISKFPIGFRPWAARVSASI